MSDKADDSLVYTHRQFWERLQISERRWYELKAAGIFDHLEAPIPRRYSRAKVEAWINGQPTRAWAVSA